MAIHDIKIANREVGPSHPPFVIAEMSGNHNQSLERALEIVEAAAKSGAHALKLQTYTADTMTIDIEGKGFSITDDDSLWKGQNLYQLYQKAHTPWDWHKPIFERCRELGMIPFSTPFDNSAVDFLETLDVPAYKVASFENADLPLIAYIAATKKPIIISTGMASIAELDETIRTVRKQGCDDIILLKCTSSYPATPEGSNIRTIPHMSDLFNVQVGLSDHTLGIGVPLAAVSLGATVIEKHFTLARSDGGVDSAFSLEPKELKELVAESERAWQSLGKITYGTQTQEKKSIQFRRSLYITEDLKSGDVLTTKNLRAIRPGYGLPTKYLETLLGKRVSKDVKKGMPFDWSILG